MSRLPAPGFSRLRAPGSYSNKPAVVAASRVPLPADESQDDETFKKPQPPLIQQIERPRLQPSQDIRPSKSTGLRVLPKASSQSNISHGPSPYDRSRPSSNQIPYVGKKRATTGALKAPETRVLKPPESRGAIKQVKRVLSPSTRNNMGNSNPISKPVKRQLIPDVSNAQSKLIRPKGTIDRPKSSTGMIQPRITGLTAKKSDSPLTSKKGISRSLQSIPQSAKPRGSNSSKLVKSTSQDELSTSNVKNSSKPNLATIPSGKSSRLGRFGKPNGIRPRASSHVNNVENPMNISTPCHVGKPGTNQQLNKLKISPIMDNSLLENNNNNVEVNTTFDNSLNAHPIHIKETAPSDESLSFDVVDNDIMRQTVDGLNATYNKPIPINSETMNLGATAANNLNLSILCDGPQNSNSNINNNDNSNLAMELNATRVISVSEVVGVKSDELNNLYDVSGNASDPNTIPSIDSISFENTEQYANTFKVTDVTSYFNQTRVIPAMDSISAKNTKHIDTNTVNVTNKNEDDALFSDSDFIGNQIMPSCDDDTPIKNDKSVNESLDANYSFTDDVLKVMAAISSNINTQAAPSVVMTTSPMKEVGVGHMTEYVMHHDLIHTNKLTSNTSTTFSNNLQSSVKSETLQDMTSQEQMLNLDLTNVSKPKSHSITEYPVLPTTPVKDAENDDTFFDISNTRAYTVSAADLRRNKVTRRNTFQSHDSSKFRMPKEMNILETLEGNILMDNTSFLQFSNDTRALKTMLLKLKRTLLEVDCPSPLVKVPLKRSNSCAARQVGDALMHMPLLSPRISNSSPMAVVDPLIPSCDSEEIAKETTVNVSSSISVGTQESTTSLGEKFQESLRRIEELEKEGECQKYTIKLLQTQLETTALKEEDLLEENILLQEEINNLNEKLQRILAVGGRERTISSGSYKDEFDISDTTSRKVILQRMYSNEGK